MAPVLANEVCRLRECIAEFSQLNNEPSWPRFRGVCEFPQYRAILTALYNLAGGGPMIDLGCGEAHVTKNFEGVLVDSVVRPNKKLPVAKMDIRDAPAKFADRRFRLMIMTDVIEHLSGEDGLKLLAGMEPLCAAQVIFTPVGPFHKEQGTEHPDTHKSAWYPEQFHRAGWTVWEFPTFHRFESGKEFLGAFWAWKFRDSPARSVEELAMITGITL